MHLSVFKRVVINDERTRIDKYSCLQGLAQNVANKKLTLSYTLHDTFGIRFYFFPFL